MKLLKYENAKLKQQFIFTLPASKEVCGRLCPGCYAHKAQVRFPKTVLPYRESMLAASQADSFVATIVAELSSTRRSSRTVRIHESGDFYSQEYLDKWTAIAKLSPTFTFYAFTKRMKDFDFSVAKSLPNFIVIDSLQSGKLNYGKLSTLDQSKFICPSTLGQPVVCGQSCRYCMTKAAQHETPQFVQH